MHQIFFVYINLLGGSNVNDLKQDGDIQSQARIRLSKDELRTDILSDRWRMADGGWRMTDDGWRIADDGWQMMEDTWQMTDDYV